MSKVLRTVGTAVAIVGSVALAAGTLGASIGVSAAALAAIGTKAAIAGSLLSTAGALTAKVPTNHRQGTQLQFKADPGAPIPYVVGRTAVGGNIVYRDTTGKDNHYQIITSILSISTASTGIGGIDGFTADRVSVPFAGTAAQGYYRGWMWQQNQVGAAPEAVALTGGSPVGSTPYWTADHRLSGFAASAWALLFDTKARRYAQGEPQPAWIVRGVKVYDPRLDSTYPGGSGPCRWADPSDVTAHSAARATWVYSDSPALHGLMWRLGVWLRDETNPAARYEKVMGIGAPIDLIDVSAIVHAANVQQANGWTIGGQFDSAQDRWEVLKLMDRIGGSEPIANGALMSTLVKAPRVSLRTITAADLADGSLSAPGMRMRSERLNGYRARFRSEAHGWEMVPIDIVQVPAYVTEDGRAKTGSGDFSLCQDADQCAELAAYEVFDSRELEPVVLRLKPFAAGYRLGDCLTIDIPEVGIEMRDVVVRGRRVDPATSIVTLTMRTETAGKHDAALGRTGVAPSTPTLTAAGDRIAEPLAGSWALTAGSATSDGLIVPALIVKGEVDNSNADAILVEYRRVGSGAWLSGGLLPPDTREQMISPVEADASYEVQVRYRGRGIYSNALLLASVRTDAAVADWQTGVRGPGKPTDNADKTSENTSKDTAAVSGKPSTEVIATLDRIGPLAEAFDLLERTTIDHDALIRQRDRDVVRLHEAMMRAVLESNRTREVLRDAGVVVDAATGKVTIYGVDQAQERVSRVEIDLDATKGRIRLLATSDYVNEQIARAQLDPSGKAALEEIITRLSSAEIDIDGLDATIRLKADATTVTTLGGKVTSVETDISALREAISLKASTTEVNAIDTRVKAAELALTTLGDVASLELAVRQARYAADTAATGALGSLLTADEQHRRTQVAAAEARQELFAKIGDGLTAEAAARLALAVRVGDADARVGREELARIEGDRSQAQALTTLQAKVGEDMAAQATSLRRAISEGDKVSADAIEQVRVSMDGQDTSISDLREVVIGPEGSTARALTVLDNNGRVTGTRQTNDGKVSAFEVLSDRFGVYHPVTGALLFYVDMDGAVVGKLKADSITTRELNDGSLGGMSGAQYYSAIDFAFAGGGWQPVLSAPILPRYDKPVQGLFNLATRHTGGKSYAEHRVRVVRDDGVILYGKNGGAPANTGSEGWNATYLFFDPAPSAGTQRQYTLELRMLNSGDRMQVTDRSFFLQELSRVAVQGIYVQPDPGGGGGYDGGSGGGAGGGGGGVRPVVNQQ